MSCSNNLWNYITEREFNLKHLYLWKHKLRKAHSLDRGGQSDI